MKKLTIFVLVLIFTIAVFIGCSNQSENDVIPPDIASSEDIIDYEPIYLEYIKENSDFFSRGMILSDLNDDKVPELFSIAYDEEGDLLQYHELKDGAVITSNENAVKTYIDPSSQIRPATYFERPGDFFGVYNNKTTGEKAIINSIADGSEKDILDIITFEDGKLVLKKEGIKAAVENRWNIQERRDSVMRDYELVEDGYYSYCLIKGNLGEGELTPEEVFVELNNGFKSQKQPGEYENIKDDEFYCYIRNISLTEGKIDLIPVEYISYDEFKKAIDGDRIVTVNGEEMSIKTDDLYEYKKLLIARLYAMPWFEYIFDVPTEENPDSIIEGYMGNNTVKVKISKDLKIRYGVLGYNEDGTPSDYETLGRNQEYKVEEYLPHFAEFGMGSYYKATVKNGEIVYLDVLYHD